MIDSLFLVKVGFTEAPFTVRDPDTVGRWVRSNVIVRAYCQDIVVLKPRYIKQRPFSSDDSSLFDIITDPAEPSEKAWYRITMSYDSSGQTSEIFYDGEESIYAPYHRKDFSQFDKMVLDEAVRLYVEDTGG